MSELAVNIPIRTTANTAGTTAVTKSLETLETEVKQLTQQMRQLATDSDAFNETRTRLATLNDEIKVLKHGKDEAAGSARNFGQAMLQGSRGVQDFAAAGIPGMVNNVESLATAMGLGASAAGGLTLAFVGVELIMKNWPAIKAAFGSKDEMKDFWSSLTPEDSYKTSLREVAEYQERLASAIERASEARKKALETQQQEADWLESQKKKWEAVLPEKLPELPGMGGPSAGLVKAANNQAGEETKYDAELAKFRNLDAATEKQKKEITDTEKRMNLDVLLQSQLKADEEEEANLPSGPDRWSKQNEIRARMEQRRKQTQAEQQGLGSVPLTGQLTGDGEKDVEVLKASLAEAKERLNDLENKRLEAAGAVESQRGNVEQATQATSRAAATDREAEGITAAKAGLLPLPGQFAGADAAMGIPPQDPAKDAFNKGVSALDEAVGDGKGDTSAEVQVIERMRAAIESGKMDRAAALERALREMESLQANGSEMEQRLTSTLSAFAQTMASLASRLSAIEGEVNTINSNRVR